MLLCLLVSQVSWAQESTPAVAELRVITEPADAEIYLETSGRRKYEEYLGSANEKILLDLSRFEDASGFNLVIRRQGYFDKGERIPIGYFETQERYPEFGSIRLEPHNRFVPVLVFLRSHAAMLVLLFTLSLVGALWWRRTRRSVKESAYPVAVTSDNLINTEISGYLVQELVGTGASAKVYRAKSLSDNSPPVAIKVFRSENLSSDDFLARFRREADVCRKLNHKGIVHLLDWGTLEDDTPYLVMEFVEGQTLSEACNGAQEPRIALDYLRQAGEALDYAHQMGVIHRDVKPDNFLLTPDGRLKLMDFGLARQVLSSFTKTGHTLGTPAYMSPEQIRGTFVDHRSDQYSLGAMGYQLIAGKRPFVDEETEAAPVLFKQVNHDPTPLSQIVDGLPSEVEALVSRLMNRKPEERFPNMKEVVETIDHLSKSLKLDH